jgi:hypothetical protein
LTLLAEVAAWISLLLGSQASVVPWRDTLPETAQAIATVADARPLPGSDARQTAAVLVVMAFRESAFQLDAVGDGGAARGLWQVHAGTLGHPVATDAEAQAWDALGLLDTSWRICSKHPLADRIGWYAAGGVGCERRLGLSRFRMSEVARLLRTPHS